MKPRVEDGKRKEASKGALEKVLWLRPVSQLLHLCAHGKMADSG